MFDPTITEIDLHVAANTLLTFQKQTEQSVINALDTLTFAKDFGKEKTLEASLSGLVKELCPDEEPKSLSPKAFRIYTFALVLLRREQISRTPDDVKAHPTYRQLAVNSAIQSIFNTDEAVFVKEPINLLRRLSTLFSGVSLQKNEYLLRPSSHPDEEDVQIFTVTFRTPQNSLLNERIRRLPDGTFLSAKDTYPSLSDLLQAEYNSRGLSPSKEL